MAKLLYVTATPKPDSKFSKGMQLGEAFIEAFKQEQPDVEITHMHLYDMDIPTIDMDMLYARAKLSFMGKTMDELSEEERTQIKAMHALADRFIDNDYYVFVSPIWNLGSPAILKSFMDNLFIAGKTFDPDPGNRRGLLTGRKAIHLQTRGGIYSEGPLKDFNFGDQYLTTALGFLGMEVLDTVYAEGVDHFPKEVPAIMAAAKEKAAAAAHEMARGKVAVE
ncbi:NAD(P)H dehydrogenase [Neobacillus notoginsengisoli]|uniref:FMN dependent NADH:quinone oxidoreductase n=1 Tax=Neobacillus notoginsengisoli TaxID=1578198 RepID=A0A417YSR1_9BACI|nr:NAD(P)H-dependent oxidoreductase [Neobacillus notoginsengisoli]RHW39012.1 NAD(P)H dehydrogenase [Neobacillus notoginsengisoli]